MKTTFDLNKIGKQNPYTTPATFFDTLEENIWKEVKKDYMRPRTSEFQIIIKWAVAIAASIALVFFIHINFNQQSSSTINDVDHAFSQLCTDDQAFLLSVYQEDVFIRE